MSHEDATAIDAETRYARLAAGLLVRARRPEPDGPAPGEREAAIAALAGALATRPVRLVRRRVVVGLGAVAVALAAVALVQFGRDDHVTARLDRGPLVPAGTVVQADSGRTVSLSLSTGTRLRLSDTGRMRLAELSSRQRFVLETGRLSAHVAPLARGHRFVIATPDAEIEVRGTAFDVVVAPEHVPCGGGITQVNVSEGLVTVRRGSHVWQVAAGRRWPDACPRSRPDARAQTPPAAAPLGDLSTKAVLAAEAGAASPPSDSPPRTRPVALAPRKQPVAGAGRASSSLREQNDLFAAAMGARRRGDLDGARRALDDLIVRFPFGALASSARDELAELRRPVAGVADPRP